MKKIISAIFLVLLGTTLLAQTKHVVLISIDGLRPDFYKDKKWNTPNLQRLMKDGVFADGVNSVFPSVTYPAHTSIITGAQPGRHGIYFNSPFESKKGRWYWEENLIKTPTIWDAAKDAGLQSAAIMWPVTVGAPIDYNFPVRRADRGDKTGQLEITKPFITPSNMLAEMEKKMGKFTDKDFNSSNSIDITIGKMASYIIENYKPALTAIHFITVDHQQHSYGNDAKEVQIAIAKVDSMIGTVMATVEKAGLTKSTSFIITGDHGMADVEFSFSPNAILAQHGFIDKDGWRAKFNGSGGSAFLFLKDKNDKETLNSITKILTSLPEQQKKLFRILDRQEMDEAGANPEAALALAMKKGVAVAGDMERDVVVPVKENRGNHGYFPDFDEIKTGFIASGAGINSGVAISEMGIVDIAPLISELLNLNFQAPDGKLVPRILN